MQRLEALPPPPGVIASLQAGYDIVSSRIGLIALPLLLDVYLWLGPRLSIGNLFREAFNNWLDLLRQAAFPSGELEIYTANAKIVMETAEKLNWVGWIRTSPIGLPAMMLDLPKDLPVQTPLGVQTLVQIPSFGWMIISMLVLTLLGWLVGGAYFRLVAGASLGEQEAGVGLLRALVQTVLLSILWRIGAILLFVPVLFLIGFVATINPLLAQVITFIILFFAFWLVVPLAFMPHGIFMNRQNALLSILSSLRLARFTLPTSSMFVFGVFLLWFGLDYLWKIPTNDSWLMLAGIAGHAFILTTLLSASFVYYRDMNNWLQAVQAQFPQMNRRSFRKL